MKLDAQVLPLSLLICTRSMLINIKDHKSFFIVEITGVQDIWLARILYRHFCSCLNGVCVRSF